MRIVTPLVLAFGIAATASPSFAQQTMLDRLIGKVIHPGTTAAAAGTGAALPADAAASITAAQTATIQRLLAAPLADRQIAADRAAAAPLITRLLTIGACARSSAAWNAINRDSLSPRSYQPPSYNELVAMENLPLSRQEQLPRRRAAHRLVEAGAQCAQVPRLLHRAGLG